MLTYRHNVIPTPTAPEVTGVVDGGIYNVDVIPVFTAPIATLNGVEYLSGTPITTDGSYTLVVSDAFGNSTSMAFNIDKTAPLVSGVQDGGTYSSATPSFTEGTAELNGNTFVSGTTINTAGIYTLIVIDTAGNSTTVTFTIDNSAPTITGVVDGELYNVDVTPSFTEGTATLNGNAYTSDTPITTEGSYVLVVTDLAANSTTISFTIDKTAPLVSGVQDGSTYSSATPTFTEGTAVLDGNPYTSGTVVDTDGAHTLVVTDTAGNSTTVAFTIDKTAPIITGVVNGGLYNVDVTPSFTEGTATLNGNAYTSGTLITAEGTYTLVVNDGVGNSTTVSFIIDKSVSIPTVMIPVYVNTSDEIAYPVTGTGEAYATVNVTVSDGVNPSVISIVAVDSTGSFSLTMDLSSLNEGDLEFKIGQTDQAGNISTPSILPIIKDTIAPATPTGVGFSGYINTTNVTSYTVSGMVESNGTAVVNISDSGSGSINQSVVADASGYFSYTFDLSSLLDGTINFSVSQVDEAGNVSTAFITSGGKDTIIPNAPVITKTEEVNASNVSSYTVMGTAERYANISIRVTDEATDVTTSTTADIDGNYSASLDLSGLIDGEGFNNIIVTQRDIGGNLSPEAIVPYIKDTVTPATPTISISSYVNLDNMSTYTASGTAEYKANVVVEITDGVATVTGTAVGDMYDSYSMTLDLSGLADGTLTVNRYQTDEVGNQSSIGTVTIAKDTIAPPTPSAVSGQYVYINSSNETAYNVIVTAEPNSDIEITVTDEIANTVTASGITDGTGSVTATLDLSTLIDGAITISAVQFDAAGNTSTIREDSVAKTKDTIAPLAPSVSNTGYVNSSNQINYIVTGIATEPNGSIYVEAYQAGHSVITNTGTIDATGHFSVNLNLMTLDEGSIQINTNQKDNAGNYSTPVSVTLTIDSVSPYASDWAQEAVGVNNNQWEMNDSVKLLIQESGSGTDWTSVSDGTLTSWNASTTETITIVDGQTSFTLANVGTFTDATGFSVAGGDGSATITFTITRMDDHTLEVKVTGLDSDGSVDTVTSVGTATFVIDASIQDIAGNVVEMFTPVDNMNTPDPLF